MKGLPMMMVVLAIVVQAMVQAENPSFSHLSLNHPSSLTPFPHSAPIISFYPHNDAKHQQNRSNLTRQNTPKKKEDPRSVSTPKEEQNPGSIDTPNEKETTIPKLEAARIACAGECTKVSKRL
jgi:hypothetical protein